MIVIVHRRSLRELLAAAVCLVIGHRWGGAICNAVYETRTRGCQRGCGAAHIERWRL